MVSDVQRDEIDEEIVLPPTKKTKKVGASSKDKEKEMIKIKRKVCDTSLLYKI